MKTNLEKLVIVVCLIFLGFASFSVGAAEPKTLEEALLNYNWEWTHPGKPPGLIKFDANGTAGGLHPNWHWKITGPRTAIAYDPISQDGKPSTWRAELKFDETFSRLEATATDSDHRGHTYTGRRMERLENSSNAIANNNQSAIDNLIERKATLADDVCSSLDRNVPDILREVISEMREQLLDEAAKRPVASQAAYQSGAQFCNGLIAAYDERAKALARFRNDAPSRITVWPMPAAAHPNWLDYVVARDKAAAATKNNTLETPFAKQNRVQWATRAEALRASLDTLYGQFRTAARQPEKERTAVAP